VTKSNSNLSALQRIAKEDIYSSNYGNNRFAEEDEQEEGKGKEVDILNKWYSHWSLNFGRGKGLEHILKKIK